MYDKNLKTIDKLSNVWKSTENYAKMLEPIKMHEGVHGSDQRRIHLGSFLYFCEQHF